MTQQDDSKTLFLFANQSHPVGANSDLWRQIWSEDPTLVPVDSSQGTMNEITMVSHVLTGRVKSRDIDIVASSALQREYPAERPVCLYALTEVEVVDCRLWNA